MCKYIQKQTTAEAVGISTLSQEKHNVIHGMVSHRPIIAHFDMNSYYTLFDCPLALQCSKLSVFAYLYTIVVYRKKTIKCRNMKLMSEFVFFADIIF